MCLKVFFLIKREVFFFFKKVREFYVERFSFWKRSIIL